MDRARLDRILVAFAARNPSEDHTEIGPLDFDQMQVSALCLTHRLAVVPSHGIKNGRCTCGDKNCKRRGRHPRTPHDLQDATSDPGLARQFWMDWPKAKVIIPTGQQGIIAVTARGQKGDRALAALVDKDEVSTETIEFRGRRTHTYLLRVPDDAIPNGRVRLAEGVVVHGRGSFIVVPRNVTRPGRYKQLFDGEIAAAPNWLLRLLGSEPIAAPTSPEKLPIAEPKAAEPPMIPERTFAETFAFELVRVPLNGIVVPDGTPRCDDDKVRALAESYRITDVRRPLAVRFVAERTRESDPVVRLLSDPHQLAALKRLGITCADCLVIKGDETDERLWKLAELIHQPEVKVLDKAQAVMEWVRLVREKGGQVAHPRGGRQPHDKGFAAAERFLGISRRDLGRAALIAKISPEAQEEIRRAKLDDIQRALLEIANESTEKQVEKVRELKERYSKPRQKRAANADTETGTRKHRVPEDEPTSPEPAAEADDEPEGTVPEESPDDVDQPSALEHSDEERFERVLVVWDQFVAPEWEQASEAVRLRFFEALGYSVVAAKKRID
jgi:hypothetical protein